MTEWSKGTKNIKIVKDIEAHTKLLLSGVVLAVDPASKSLGWALYKKGVFIDKGTIVSTKRDVNLRLQDIAAKLEQQFQDVDILAIEKIRGSRAHDYLKWAIGMVISNVKAPIFIEVPIMFWKQVTDSEYTKTDENDAEMIGRVVMQIAEEHHGKKSKRSKRQRVGRNTKAKRAE